MTRKFEFGLLVLGTLAAVATSTAFYSSFSLNHDSSWYLVATRMFLNGGTLYEDIIEINPPLSFYITAPSLFLTDIIGWREATTYFAYVSSWGGLSVVWVYTLTRRASMGRGDQLLMTGCAFIGCLLIAMQDFGQREHLMLIFAMPYLVFLIFRDESRTVGWVEQVGLGLFAFLGLGLKPYFLLIPAGIGAFRYMRSRTISEFINAANIALGLALFSYVAFILVWHPLYLDSIVPDASLVYSAYSAEPISVFLRAEMFGFVGAGLLAIFCRAELDKPTFAMLGAMVGATASYAIQFKGWNYQILPAAFFTFLATTWITVHARQRILERIPLGVLSAIAIGFTLFIQVLGGPYSSRTTESFGAFVVRDEMPILVLSSNVPPAFPFINEVNARWSSRFPTQWLLPGAISLLDATDCVREPLLCEEYRTVVANTRMRMVEDFTSFQPELVYVDDREHKSYFGSTRFDYIEFLLADPVFAEQWRDYRLLDRVGNYEVWSLAEAADSSSDE